MARKWERAWPYIVAVLFVATWYFLGCDLSSSAGYDGALEASASMCSILLGFIAAIFPVVLSLRDKGNYVDWVIRQGGDLLKSYNVEVVVSGFVLIMVVIFNYFRNDTRSFIKTFMFLAWLFCVVLFVGCCVRCMYFLFRLVLDPKNKKNNDIPLEGDAERRKKESVKKEL